MSPSVNHGVHTDVISHQPTPPIPSQALSLFLTVSMQPLCRRQRSSQATVGEISSSSVITRVQGKPLAELQSGTQPDVLDITPVPLRGARNIVMMAS